MTQVKALIYAEKIACDLEETPQVKAAMTSRQVDALQAERRMLLP